MSEVTFDFSGKNFAVVGASSGIGKQIAVDLAKSGAKVFAVGRNIDRLNALKDEFPQNIYTFSLDILKADDDSWENKLSPFVAEFGKLSGAVYTAGIGGITPLRSYDEEEARRIVDTSLWGMIRFFHIATKKKYANKSSSYVAFSSIAAYVGNKGQFAYTAAKGAVKSAVYALAKEICRDGSRINSISPGWVQSEMSEEYQSTFGEMIAPKIFDGYLLGVGKPEYISNIVLFLLSDAAAWITGTDIVVDGGALIGKD